jgi:hypothetical protein
MTATVVAFSRVAILAAGLASLSVLGYATPFCPGYVTLAPATLASIGVGTAGSGVTGACTSGFNLFSNISLAGSSVSGSAPPGAIDPNDVEVQVRQIGFDFFFILTDPIPGDWSLTGTQQFTLDLSYTVSGPPWFFFFNDELNANASGGGVVSFDSSGAGGSNPPQALPTLFNSSVPPFNGGLLFTGFPANLPDICKHYR